MLSTEAQVGIPSFVRIKPGVLRRLGIYARRHGLRRPALFISEGLPADLVREVDRGLDEVEIRGVPHIAVSDTDFDSIVELLASLPGDCDAVFGLGGGKCLDIAKYVASLAGKPYFAVPTSLSNDAFCAPQSSLMLRGRRRSLPARLPFAVTVDTEACMGAPDELWWSGIGDLVAKLTAVRDWKIAYHETGEPVNDLATLLSTGAVYQFIAHPNRDREGTRLLATALMISGIAMAMCGSSRPASGSEHLLSHALDSLPGGPRPHGMQVGTAAYLIACLQQENADLIGDVLEKTGFWSAIRREPFSRRRWMEAFRIAPSVNPQRYTILSLRDRRSELTALIDSDPRLRGCFRAD